MLDNLLKHKVLYGLILLLILLEVYHRRFFSRVHITEVPLILATMRAKEFCSCYFILAHSKEHCLSSVKKDYPIFDFQIDEQIQKVTFKNPVAQASAKFIDDRYGCSL